MKSLIAIGLLLTFFSTTASAYTYKVQNYNYTFSCNGGGAQFSLATHGGSLVGTGSFYGTDGATHTVQFRDGMTGRVQGSEELQNIGSQGTHHKIGFYLTSFHGQPTAVAGPVTLVATDKAVFSTEKAYCSVQSTFVGTQTRVHNPVCVKQWAHNPLLAGYDHWETVCD